MASSRNYTWRTGDSLWSVASSVMNNAGYTSLSACIDAIRTANVGAGTANVFDWQQITDGTTITIPYATT